MGCQLAELVEDDDVHPIQMLGDTTLPRRRSFAAAVRCNSNWG